MIDKTTYIFIPLVATWAGMIARVVIDGKLKNILEAQGKNPNPPELESYRGMIYPGQHFKRIKEDIAFRKNLNSTLGKWYAVTHVFNVIMFFCFVALVIIIK